MLTVGLVHMYEGLHIHEEGGSRVHGYRSEGGFPEEG